MEHWTYAYTTWVIKCAAILKQHSCYWGATREAEYRKAIAAMQKFCGWLYV